MNFDIIIQCRFGSKRLRGKVLYEFDNGSFLDFLCNNLKKNLSNFRLTLDYEKYYVNFKQNTVALKNIATNKKFEKYLNRKLFK